MQISKKEHKYVVSISNLSLKSKLNEKFAQIIIETTQINEYLKFVKKINNRKSNEQNKNPTEELLYEYRKIRKDMNRIRQS